MQRSHPERSIQGAARALVVAVLVLTVGACSGAAGTTSTATPASTIAPSPTIAGPASFADWTARQGFGGSSGLRELNHGAHWLQDNTYADDYSHWIFWWSGMARDLATWLDIHTPTACWADYHATVRAGLASSLTDFAALQAAADGHLGQPHDAITDLVQQQDAIFALPDPAGCA